MKKFLVFTVLLLSSFTPSFGCGYSPGGEDIRYCLLRPEYFSFKVYYAFYYNSDLWGFDYDYGHPQEKFYYEANIIDWYNYAEKKVDLASIQACNQELKLTDINPQNRNAFLQYLYKNKKTDVIRYFIWAKRCEDLEGADNDPWERKEIDLDVVHKKLLSNLLDVYAKETNAYLKRKYAFQCIREAFYAGNKNVISDIFKKEFQNSAKDYLYYWSLYFNCYTKSGGEKMVDIASLMAYCPEKTYAAYYFFSDSFKLQEGLKSAKTQLDIANLYAYASVQKTDRNLDYLTKIYQNCPDSRLLDFLLLREINKIEDWVYTPYYTNYEPSLGYSSFYSNQLDIHNTITLRARSEKDRQYAKQVLAFVNKADFSKVNNSTLWKAAQIQLQFIARDYDNCLANIAEFQKTCKEQKLLEEAEQIKALCVTANQQPGNAIVKPEVLPLLQKYIKNARFVFALGRELEYNGNIADGIAVLSLVQDTNYSYEMGNTTVPWQGNRLLTSDNLSYFYEYFDYIDFVYSADALQIIVDKINNVQKADPESYLYRKLIHDKDYLTDLLGTKYLREERLDEALKTFRTIGKKYWADNYNAWERGTYNEYYAFDQNPFYSIKYTDEFISHAEKYIVTKLSITEHLIKYIRLAENPATKDRDYYYFLIANCYYNMSDSGNSWMMRRYESSTSWYEDGTDKYLSQSYIDEREYRCRSKAMEYYQLACDNAKTEKFKALCVRMIDYARYGSPASLTTLKRKFPQFYDELSGCENLESYFKSRR